ncbi:MAG: porin family protein [Chitinophagales bacterium]
MLQTIIRSGLSLEVAGTVFTKELKGKGNKTNDPMKKIILVSLSLAAMIFSAHAQSKSTVGFYIGPNFSNVNILSPNLSAVNHSGYQFGGYWRKGGFIYGQAGLEFQQLQTDLQTDTSSGMVDMKRIQLPLYAGLNLFNFAKKVVNVRVFAGPVIGYYYGYNIGNPDFTTSDFNRFTVNGTAGAGLDVLIFSLDAGYNFGLNNLFSGNFDGKADYGFVNFGVRF